MDLIHLPIGGCLRLHLRSKTILSHSSWQVAFDLGALVVCIAVAWLIHFTVELPLHKLGHRLAAKFKSRARLVGHPVH